jgi:hypothetical protein
VIQPSSSSPEVKLATSTIRLSPSYFLPPTLTMPPELSANQQEFQHTGGEKRKRGQGLLVKWRELCELLRKVKGRCMLNGKLLEENSQVSNFKSFFSFV